MSLLYLNLGFRPEYCVVVDDTWWMRLAVLELRAWIQVRFDDLGSDFLLQVYVVCCMYLQHCTYTVHYHTICKLVQYSSGPDSSPLFGRNRPSDQHSGQGAHHHISRSEHARPCPNLSMDMLLEFERNYL